MKTAIAAKRRTENTPPPPRLNYNTWFYNCYLERRNRRPGNRISTRNVNDNRLFTGEYYSRLSISAQTWLPPHDRRRILNRPKTAFSLGMTACFALQTENNGKKATAGTFGISIGTLTMVLPA
jgi:hypothetical protein